jgi:murein DD-endopeptidase MepM/ murein hydrolase activator NlpD
MTRKRTRLFLGLLLCLTLLPVQGAGAAVDMQAEDSLEVATSAQLKAEMPVLQRVGKATKVPWYYLAAVNQYEMGIHWKKNKDNPQPSPIQIEFPPEKWSGTVNPKQDDSDPVTIKIFGGLGVDGNKDKLANRLDPEDSLFAMASWLSKEGTSEDAIRRMIWDYYQDGMVVDRITGFARIFKEAGTTDIKGNAFPIPKRYNYSYRSTWGDPRGWGGRRIHEGCDIFADHGTPVVSTSYGVVEVIGWNKYGGWRIGIRDLNNVYHYYAHLRGFEKGLKHGSLVKPGQLIGAVGSSGYGKVGTSGKFAPHLHYGMYRESGTREWAFDPTPYLRKWEREMKNARTKKKKP